MVEFALVAVILLLLFLGTVDFGRYAYTQTVIQDAARAGAEQAITTCPAPTLCETSSTANTPDVILQATVCNAAPYVALSPSISASQCATPCGPNACSNAASNQSSYCGTDVCIVTNTAVTPNTAMVYVGYNFQPISPYLSRFFPTRTCFPSAGPDAASSEGTHTLCARAGGNVTGS